MQDTKLELNKDMENLRKKNRTKTLEIKRPFSQTKNHSKNLLLKSRTSGRQNFRA
jgi:hypothetical protein